MKTTVANLFANTLVDQTFLWTDPETGYDLKCKIVSVHWETVDYEPDFLTITFTTPDLDRFHISITADTELELI